MSHFLFILRGYISNFEMNESVSLIETLDSEEELVCGGKSEAYDFARFALVTYIGTPIAIFGLLFNALLVVSILRSLLFTWSTSILAIYIALVVLIIVLCSLHHLLTFHVDQITCIPFVILSSYYLYHLHRY